MSLLTAIINQQAPAGGAQAREYNALVNFATLLQRNTCYACGGVGHPNEECGFRERLYNLAGRSKGTTRIVNGALTQLRIGAGLANLAARDFSLVAKMSSVPLKVRGIGKRPQPISFTSQDPKNLGRKRRVV